MHTSYFVDQLGHAHHQALVVFDGEAEQVLGVESGVLVHITEELRVFIGILDVHKLPRLCHQTSNPLAHLDLYGILFKRTRKSIRQIMVFTLIFGKALG